MTMNATVLSVTSGGYISLSCGHNYHLATTPDRFPKPGDPHDCLTCTVDEWARNAPPPLPAEQLEAIRAALPTCPECHGQIDKIPFVRQVTHRFNLEVNEVTGEVDADSDFYDTIDEQPAWIRPRVISLPSAMCPQRPRYTGQIDVECEQGHRWIENRLAYHFHNLEHRWDILP